MSTSARAGLDAIRTGMAKTNELFNREVFGNKNFDALDDIYTTNARILPPGTPMISGRKAIKEFWEGMVTSMNAESAVLESVDVIEAGDGVIEIGKASLTVPGADEKPVTMEVKYVVHWKQEDGHWKWNIDIWNPNS